jgi:7-keto-8-aminopelargonate synthetase-like enzyme
LSKAKRVRYGHLDMEDLERQLVTHKSEGREEGMRGLEGI